MKKMLQTSNLLAGLAAVVLLVAGCATEKPIAQSDLFFPPPPDEARLQFLTGFSSERAFRQREEKSVMMFLTGARAPSKELGKPYGGVAYDHKLFVCDTELGAVLVVDLATERFRMLETRGEGTLRVPLNIAIDRADGTTYVVDSGREQVVIFDKKGGHLATMGKKDEMKPRDVAVGKDRIYVADVKQHNVQAFDKATRKFLFEIPHAKDATNHLTRLYTPLNLALDDAGRVYVSDIGAGRVQVYDGEGNHLRSVGQMGDGLGMFARIKGIAVDRANRVYAVDALTQVAQIFNEEGKLLTYFADPGGTGKTVQNLPAKVFVDYEDVGAFQKYAAKNFEIEHLVVVLNQIGPHKVCVYGFGHKK